MKSRKIYVAGSAIAIVLPLLSGAFATTTLATTKITFADTILAKVVSEIYGYPIVQVDRNRLDNETLQRFIDLNTTEVVIIGGPAVISPRVEEELEKYFNVTRIWGVTRYETSALVSEFFWDASDKAVIVTRDLVNERASIRDVSLVRDAVDEAVEEKIPILITPTGSLDENVAEALETLGVQEVDIFTKAQNPSALSNLTKALSELGISYEIHNSYTPVCNNTVKIAVPENANWTFARDLLVGFKCVDLVPVPVNATLSELQGKYDFIVMNESALQQIRSRIMREIRERARLLARKKAEEIMQEKIDRLMLQIQSQIRMLEEYYNKTGDDEALKLLREIKERERKIWQLIGQNRYKEALKDGLEVLKELNEFEWTKELYLYRRKLMPIEEIERIKKLKKRIREQYINILRRMYNLSEEDAKELSKAISPEEIKARVLEIIRNRNRYCIQVTVYACNDKTGECREFRTPCDVPKGWRIVKNPEKVREILKEEMIKSGEISGNPTNNKSSEENNEEQEEQEIVLPARK